MQWVSTSCFSAAIAPALLYSSLQRETQQDIAGLEYTILSDANAQAAIAFGIAFRASDRTRDKLAAKKADIEGSSITRRGVLPVPAAFAIDRNGKIRFSFVNADYKIRLPAEELLAAARMIAAN